MLRNSTFEAGKGIFFLANDAVYDLALAFLNSVRTHCPNIALCLIPFDENIDRLKGLASTHRFDVFSNHTVLSMCDQISSVMHQGSIRGHYRKLACFEGNFNRFIFIDVDTIVLQSPEGLLDLLDEYDILFSHSNEERLQRWVWKETIVDAAPLSRQQIAFSANTGFILSHSHAIDLRQVYERRYHIARLKEHMALECAEQPFINYIVVTSGLRYSSLLRLVKNGTHPHLPLEKWAGNGIMFSDTDSVDHVSSNFFLYHWAGAWAPTEFDHLIDRLASFFPMRRKRKRTVRRLLSHGRLWRRYRNMRDFTG